MTLPLRWTAGAFFPLALAACGRPPFTSPSQGGPEWTEVTTPHFVLSTDKGRSRAVEVATELETMLQGLARAAFNEDRLPETRIDVVYFRRYDEYKGVADNLSAGQVSYAGSHDFERTPRAFINDNFYSDVRHIFRHELMHVLVHQFIPQAPTWLNEGLADYYATMEIVDGEAVVGRRAPGSHQWGQQVSAYDILTMTPETFYGDGEVDPESPEGEAAATARAKHYSGARILVRVLIDNDAFNERFVKYQESLSAGQSHGEAWRTTFKGVTFADLERAYDKESVSRSAAVYRRPCPIVPMSPQSIRTLTDGEVRLLWARIRPWDTAEGHQAAMEDLSKSERSRVDPAQYALVRASWSFENGERREAEQILKNAIGAVGPHRQLLNALGWVKLDMLVEQKNVTNRDIADALQSTANQLRPIAQSAAEYDWLARYSAFRGEIDEAISLERRATEINPSCLECLTAQAEFVFQKGLPMDSLALAYRALALAPDGTKLPKVFMRDVAKYRAAVRRAAPNDPAPTATPAAPAKAPSGPSQKR